jgi:hypothetical protein
LRWAGARFLLEGSLGSHHGESDFAAPPFGLLGLFEPLLLVSDSHGLVGSDAQASRDSIPLDPPLTVLFFGDFGEVGAQSVRTERVLVRRSPTLHQALEDLFAETVWGSI